MINKSRWLTLGTICIGTLLFTFMFFSQLEVAHTQAQQPEAFLYPPYFGTKEGEAVLHHEYSNDDL